jgi:protein gp37
MGVKTGISWTDATWNPIRGCSPVSPGCKNCYAKKIAKRFSFPGGPYEGLVRINATGERTDDWNGEIHNVEEHLLDPLKWKTPRRIFVNSMSDLFHENVTDEMRDKIFAVMALCPQHTFQVLTKRPERMFRYWLQDPSDRRTRQLTWIHSTPQVERYYQKQDAQWQAGKAPEIDLGIIAQNVHLGVSVEDQKTADERIPLLLRTPAAVRFISAEPLLGPIDLTAVPQIDLPGVAVGTPLLHWVIVGGESGPKARSMHPDWARSLRDQCKAAGVPFFFKQWGEWSPSDEPGSVADIASRAIISKKRRAQMHNFGDGEFPSFVFRVGAKAAGHLLDGVEHHEFPAREGLVCG